MMARMMEVAGIVRRWCWWRNFKQYGGKGHGTKNPIGKTPLWQKPPDNTPQGQNPLGQNLSNMKFGQKPPFILSSHHLKQGALWGSTPLYGIIKHQEHDWFIHYTRLYCSNIFSAKLIFGVKLIFGAKLIFSE